MGQKLHEVIPVSLNQDGIDRGTLGVNEEMVLAARRPVIG